MKSYVIQFEPRHKEKIVDLIGDFSNDIIIDRVDDDRVGISIELEDEESDRLYYRLKHEISLSLKLNL